MIALCITFIIAAIGLIRLAIVGTPIERKLYWLKVNCYSTYVLFKDYIQDIIATWRRR